MLHFFKRILSPVIPLLKRSWLVVLFLLLLSGWFYWFQWRPARIRSACQKEAFTVTADLMELSSKTTSVDDFDKSLKRLYEMCLHKYGITH